MAIKDQFKKVKNMNLGNINLNNLTSGVPLVKDNFTKEIEAKMQARDQVYNYIAMDVVDLYKKGMLNIPQLDIHFDKLAELENEMLEKINKLGIGPGGLGGTCTAFAVNINTYPTHIAGLPVAVNICCHVNRHSVREI